jgi:uncharacterized protein (TIGR04551 family)
VKRSRHAARAVFALALFAPATARATGFTDIGEDHTPRDKTSVEVDGYMRMRGEVLNNLDLDRGLTPSGRPLFPVPLGDPNAQSLTYADMRLRTDIAVYAPGTAVAVKARLDFLDDYPLGGSYAGVPSASTTQLSPPGAVRVKRAYGEALTPLGLLVAGRMGNQWGLGMLANGGDCADCNSGDAADRVAFLSPVLGHVIAAAYDISAIGPLVPSSNGATAIELEPSANVNNATLAVLNFRDDFARTRRRLAGKTTIEYGAYLSHRWQPSDVPATYLPTAQPIAINASQVMARGFTATVIDGWARVTHPFFRVEAEWAFLTGQVDQPSLVPGVLYHQPVTSTQMGAALESEVGKLEGRVFAGLDGGYASGDPSPGFGANTGIGAPYPRAGELDGPQADPPRKNSVNNFRFHPDYFIDRILFREIIGTVTDAVYVRPHARYRIVDSRAFDLTAHVASIASWAVFATSAPGGKSPLGVEIDPTLAYQSKDGFGAALEYAVLFPLSGLDNPVQHLTARPAQLARVRLMYRF